MNNINNNKIIDISFFFKRIYEELEQNADHFEIYPLGDIREAERVGFGNNTGSNIVFAEDTAVELGAPNTISSSVSLYGYDYPKKMGTLWITGNEIFKLKKSSISFLQIVLLSLDSNISGINNIKLNKLKNLSNELPGFMSRNMAGKQWIRISKKLYNKKFSLYSLGQCIWKNYVDNLTGLKGIDIVLMAGADSKLLSVFKPLVEGSGIILSENRKTKWINNGIISCNDLNCSECDDKPSCDILQKIVSRRGEVSE